MSEIETWSKWESQTVNGLFPLRQYLGHSNHSVVFQTDHRAQKAAIKLLPEDPATAEAQVAQWRAMAALSHPNLVRILDTGRCVLGGHPFLFVVTEFAEQTLAQILPHRPLSIDETRELLGPALAALGFLHDKNLVQAGLKPPNFLVIDDQLKLASDTIRNVGAGPPPGAKPSIYDAPEARTHTIETASDAWGLGVTLVEALTQSPPRWNNDRSGEIILPATMPADFADTLRRCLSRNPAVRPTIAELQAQFTPAAKRTEEAPPVEAAEPAAVLPAAEAVPAAAAVDIKAATEPTPPPPLPTRISPTIEAAPARTTSHASLPRWLVPVAAIGLVLLLVTWLNVRSHRRPESPPVIADTAPQMLPPASPAPPPPPKSTEAPSAVVHREIPIASRGARDSIHGTIKVPVLVTVDRTGGVVSTSLESHGPSKYFARLGNDAAKKWRFTPTDVAGPRQWLIEFEFSRSGTQAQSEPRHPPGVVKAFKN